ncbi:hypothetical protein [Neoroseomonas lacus]|uniref:Uncharacterized protein n=1 Tax=Neoroseomonas lacus TaxID=287609 RepID=A0A917NXR7_9PROT|nr:hypothetical protein [Neoroseomonas lacus]GGJ35537.1 hypothetical protein GCM10011320_49110 [Neoroseomonas lacus]
MTADRPAAAKTLGSQGGGPVRGLLHLIRERDPGPCRPAPLSGHPATISWMVAGWGWAGAVFVRAENALLLMWEKEMSLQRIDWIVCSRSWGVPQSLIVATLSGSSLLGRAQLRFSGSGIGIEVINRRADEADVAIDIAGDAVMGPRSLFVALDGRLYEVPDVFRVVAPVGTSYSGSASHGIGSHLL